jgi:hypothetical protein
VTAEHLTSLHDLRYCLACIEYILDFAEHHHGDPQRVPYPGQRVDQTSLGLSLQILNHKSLLSDHSTR